MKVSLVKHTNNQIINSPYDSSFPISFLRNELYKRIDSATQLSNSILSIYECSLIGKEINNPRMYRYVVDAPKKILDLIDKGTLKLDKNRDGKTFAQLRNNGQYADKIPIKKEDL